MPEVHVPDLDEHEAPPTPPAPVIAHPRSRVKSIVRVGLEVLLIAMGVFLGLAGEQWRQNVEHRDNAELALRRFRTEVSSNRAKVEQVREYHATLRTRFNEYLAASPQERKSMRLSIEGIQVVFFEHAAWDLALATVARLHRSRRCRHAVTHLQHAGSCQRPDEWRHAVDVSAPPF